VAKYVGDRYTQHSTGVGDGPDGFVALSNGFIKHNPQREVEAVPTGPQPNSGKF